MPCAWILLSSQFTPDAVVLDDAANALAAVMQRSRAAANSAVASFDIRFMCAIPFENVPIQIKIVALEIVAFSITDTVQIVYRGSLGNV